MRSIPTTYKGTKFRSRLEARYAIFLDTLGIKWYYEFEGFELSNGKWYLPDFFLPDIRLRNDKKPGVYLEIKPSEEIMDESADLFKHFDGNLVVAVGTPPEHMWDNPWLYEYHSKLWDSPMVFTQCSKCRKMKIDFCDSSYFTCPVCDSETIYPELYDQARKRFIKNQF